eukprot:TRINITY_DN10600_c0_g1_i1.p1 TRINITY_DN10600_c0_g1~~TRINITY_DN10600_c0_g1_i1.p1  ORF type:complete len:320 (-),score=43.87 TRINITY_DN10600_c0_g1_i1:38-997(-)
MEMLVDFGWPLVITVVLVVLGYGLWGGKEGRKAAPVFSGPSVLEEIMRKQELRERERRRKVSDLLSMPLEYDPVHCPALERIQSNIANSECTFAKKSKIWGSYPWDNTLTLEQNIQKSIPAVARFYDCGEENKLDGFLFEVQGKQYSDTVENFGETVRRVLTVIAENDPAENAMSSISGRRGWRFAWNKENTFITSFAPCYPSTHPRYPWDSSREFDSCWVLLQPEWSFGHHNIGPDHPWDDTKLTQRQKIRCKFRDAGRPYYVPPSRFYPMAPMVVPPLELNGKFIEWWIPLEIRKQRPIEPERLASPDPFSLIHYDT